MRWCRPSAARTWRCRSSGSKRLRSAGDRARRCSGSACRRRSARSMRWRDFSAADSIDTRDDGSRRCRRCGTGGGAAQDRAVERSRRRHPRRVHRRARRRRRLSPGHHRRHLREEEARSADRGPGRGHGEDRRSRARSRAVRRRRGRRGTSIWTAIHPRLLELVRAHRSTLIFVNSRRIAERLAAALNELAGEALVRSHHGSLARPQRIEVEDRLKAGQPPRPGRHLVARARHRHGGDRPGRSRSRRRRPSPAGCSASGAPATPSARPAAASSFRSSAAISSRVPPSPARCTRRASRRSAIRAIRSTCSPSRSSRWWRWTTGTWTRCSPRCARRAVRRLSRSVFEGVLDMLSGRYPSDEFADLRPRITWDRLKNRLTAREGAKRVAIINGGTIPDRGLYGVFLPASAARARASASSTRRWSSRAGSARRSCSARRPGASRRSPTIACWSRPRPASRARCRSGRRTPPGRPLELGRQIGELMRDAAAPSARRRGRSGWSQHTISMQQAAENLVRYLADQAAAAGAVPDDRTIVIERCRDELGDWRICVLSPFGGRIHAPWAMAAVERARAEPGSTWKRCGPTTGSSCDFPRRRIRPTRR